MKAGIRTWVGMSARVSGRSSFAEPANSARSFVRVWSNMNSRIGFSARLKRRRLGDLLGAQRVDRLLLDLVEGRRHHEDRQEQRDADEHLVRRRGRRAEAGADEAQDDEDAGEAGEREERGRDQRERRRSAAGSRPRWSRRPSPDHRPAAQLVEAAAQRPAVRRRRRDRRRPRSRLEQPERAGLGLRVGADRRDAVLADADEHDLVARAHEVQRAVRAERQRGERLQAGALGAASRLDLTCLRIQVRP